MLTFVNSKIKEPVPVLLKIINDPALTNIIVSQDYVATMGRK